MVQKGVFNLFQSVDRGNGHNRSTPRNKQTKFSLLPSELVRIDRVCTQMRHCVSRQDKLVVSKGMRMGEVGIERTAQLLYNFIEDEV